MFLFHKRTKNIIKWVWGVFAVIIMLSMIFTYSGFTRLASTAPVVPPDTLAQENASTSPELQALLDEVRASGTATQKNDTAPTDASATPPASKTPPVQELNFGL